MDRNRQRIIDTDTDGGKQFAHTESLKNKVEAVKLIDASEAFILVAMGGGKTRAMVNMPMARVPQALDAIEKNHRGPAGYGCKGEDKRAYRRERW